MASERRRVAALTAKLCLFAYLVLASYAVARPPIESMFLAAYRSTGLPVVWLAVAASVLVAVAAMRKAVTVWRLPRVFVGAAALSALSLAALLAAHSTGLREASFLLYVWKDVYVVVLIELFWSIANVITPLSRARSTYGLFCVAGSLGGVSGNLVAGIVSRHFGSGAAPWLVVPLLLAACLACIATLERDGASAAAGPVPPAAGPATPGPHAPSEPEGTERSARRDRQLYLMLLVVVAAQLCITLVDFEFNAVVEREFSEVDARTAAIGRVYATVDGVSMLLQLASGLLLRAIGVPAALVVVPVALGLALGGVAAIPRFVAVAIAKVTSKSLDYSIFRVAKELCYLPLSYADKTRGKAVIDVLVYRLAKAGASLLLLGMAAAHLTGWVIPIAMATVVAWTMLAVLLGRSQRRLLTGS